MDRGGSQLKGTAIFFEKEAGYQLLAGAEEPEALEGTFEAVCAPAG